MRTFLAACRARWKQLTPLSRDVTFVLVFKASALGILWALFFSAPLSRHMSVVPERVAAQILAPVAAPPETSDALR
jgi:hypothetical protein